MPIVQELISRKGPRYLGDNLVINQKSNNNEITK
jgi:hypothetical protein